MPKVRPLTEAQRVDARCRKRTQALRDGLVLYKARHSVTNKELSETANIGINTVGQLLQGRQIMARVDTFWRLLDLAGLEVRRREELLP